MPYSMDLRKRVIESVKSGMSKAKASRSFNVCKQTIYNWLERSETTGDIKPITYDILRISLPQCCVLVLSSL
jgi:transposase